MTSVIVDFVVVVVEIITSSSTVVAIEVSVPAAYTCSLWYVNAMKAVYVHLVRTFC